MYKFAPRFLLGFSIGLAALAGAAGISGCHSASTTAATPDNSGADPADANMAPVDNSQPQQAAPQARVLGVSSQAPPQQSSEQYSQEQAPPPDQSYPADQDAQDYNQLNSDADIQPEDYSDQPPPELPVYEQPEAPDPNYLWTPGYWAWSPGGYYWVPGAWCAPPYYGALWTPGYWGFYGSRWGFHRGYWGRYVGFYGGINYGFGYTGRGYYGGYWNGNNFYYNRSVNRIPSRINYVYNRSVPNNNMGNRVSYNGGRGGLSVRPQPAELAAMRGPRTPPMTTQLQNQREASQNKQQFFNQNKGRPAVAVAARPIAAQPGIARPNFGTQPANRPGQPANRPGQPQTRPGQPAVQPGRPGQPENRPQVQPARPGQPQTRPAQPESRPAQPQNRPAQPQQQARPQPQSRPAPQQEARPQPQARPAPQQQARPQPQARPAPQQARPQPQSRPQPQGKPEEKPR
jgi:hypothetical protein